MIKKINSITDPYVFWISNALIFTLIFLTVFFGNVFVEYTSGLKTILLKNLGWAYILPIFWIMFYVVRIYFTSGKIKIGGPEAEPEFSTFSWVSMLFSAGLGIGLFYSGVMEPMSHYFTSPHVAGLESYKRFISALDVTYFHWGLGPWVLYSATGLMFAYKSFNQNKPFVYAAYIPERYKLIRTVVNIFAILSILIGVIIAFAMGVKQINVGLNEVFPSIPITKSVQVTVVVLITFVATLSVLSGLKKGIRFLSEINIWLAMALFSCVLISCVSIPVVINSFIQALGSHASNFIAELAYTGAFEDKTWLSNWTILYWAWWASWTPFVGLFIARISNGRTIKDFLFYTIIVPCLMCFVWFTVFGIAGYEVHTQGIADFSSLIKSAPHKSLFLVLNQSFAPTALSILAVVCIIIFYITSSDSGSYIVDTIASGGKKSPHAYLKLYWSLIEGLLAIVLILFGGILFIKDLVILLSLPMILYLCFGVYKLELLLKEESQNEI